MDGESLPRGKAPRPAGDSTKKVKVFGFKNKNTKQKKDKKVHSKIPSSIKRQDFTQGCITMGTIISIQDDMLIVELPGNTKGMLSLTEINDPFLERLKSAIDEQEELPEITDFYNVGDFIQAAVLSAGTSPVELSTRPALVNSLIKPKEGQILSAAVLSKEDKGYLLDIGMDNAKGFIKFPAEFQIGQPLFVTVTEESESGIIKCEQIKDCFFPSQYITKPHFDTLRPTNVLDAIVTSNSPKGSYAMVIAGSFNGFCTKYSSARHLPPGEAIQVRPVFIDPAQKTVWVSTIPSVVAGQRPRCLDVKIGSKIDTVVSRIRSGVGIECSFDDDIRVFIDMRDTKSDVALVEGDAHLVRVTERHPLDDLLFASDDPEIIALPVFGAEDIRPGEVLEATVISVNPKMGVFVKLSPFFSALCPIQYADDALAMKKGEKHDCVVLTVINGQVRVALKEKFVKSKLPRITTLDDAREFAEKKEWTHGIFRRAQRGGLIVEFINDMLGMLPAAYLPVQQGADITKVYSAGHVIKTLVANVDGDKINCAVSNEEDILQLGQTVALTVTGFTADGVKVALPSKYGVVDSVIPSTQFSDYIPLSQMIWKSLNVGQKVKKCTLLRNPGANVPAVFTRKRCFRTNAATIPKDVKTIEAGQVHFGYVSGVQDYGSFISFFGRASGLIHGRQLTLGDSVNVVVDGIDENGRVQLSAPADQGESKAFLVNYLSDCSQLNVNYTIGNELPLSGDPQESEAHFYYKLEDDWRAISPVKAEEGEALSIIYVDVLSKSVYVDRPSKRQAKSKVDDEIEAEVCFVFEPVIVAKHKGRYLLAPMINYNNRQDFSGIVKRGESLKFTVVDTASSVYMAVPEYLTKGDTAGNAVTTITALNDVFVTAKLGDGRTVRVHRAQFKKAPSIGDTVSGTLMQVNATTYLVLNPQSPQRAGDFSIGREVVGVVKKITPKYLQLSLSPFVVGSVTSLQMNSDEIGDSRPLTELFAVGDLYKGYVTGMHEHTVVLSGKPPSDVSAVTRAEVFNIKDGDYAKVRCANGQQMKLDVYDVSDEFEFNPLRRFHLNQLIDVVLVGPNNVSTRPSALDGNLGTPEIKVGDVVKGYVCHSIKGALLVRIARNVTARLPFNNIADCFIKDANAMYPHGTVVTVKVMKITDNEITVSSKHSDVTGKILGFDDIVVGSIVEGHITSVRDFGVFVILHDYGNISGLVHRSNIEGDPMAYQNKVNHVVRVEVADIDSEKQKISLKFAEIVETPADAEPESDVDNEAQPEMVEVDVDISDEESEEEPQKGKKKQRLTEKEILELEAKSIAQSRPMTDQEYLTEIMKNQNASAIWVEYINRQHELGNNERALEICEKALETIDPALTEEKWNIFLIQIRLTVLTAPMKDLIGACREAVLRAAQTTGDNRMWVVFAKAVVQFRKEHAAEAWKAALKNSEGQKVAAWTEYLKWLLDEGRADFAGEELKRALSGTFINAAHDSMMLRRRFAQALFAAGHLEHGRTLFENLINERPQDVKIWNEYLTNEERFGEEGKTRSLFERVTRIDLKPEEMKSISKRWVDFEKKHGNDKKRIDHVMSVIKGYRDRA